MRGVAFLLVQGNRDQLENFLEDLGSTSLVFIDCGIRDLVEFGKQCFYTKTNRGIHREAGYSLRARRGVIWGTPPGDPSPFQVR